MKKQPKKHAVMLWTGGKDSSLALHEAVGDGYDVRCLVTFAPAQPNFLAHPLAFMRMQAEALGLRHHVFIIHEPFEKGYETALVRLRDEMGIEAVITGDIAEVGGSPNWMRERCRSLGIEVSTPLWGRDREELLAQLLGHRFKVIFSCIKTRWLTEDWVGRELNDETVAELRQVRRRNGLDLCGEEGEYHTMVTDGPQFNRAIRLGALSRRTTGSLAYMDVKEMELVPK